MTSPHRIECCPGLTMGCGMSDDGFTELSAVASGLADMYRPSPAWRGSPFKWVQSLPPGRRGAVGRQLFQQWARNQGLQAETHTSPDRQIFVVANGAQVQVKLSTLWRNGFYRFQQIRDRDFDFCLFLGLSPQSVHAWLVPKEVLDVHVIGHLGQHTGAGASETAWVTVYPKEVPGWLEPFGGSLERVHSMLVSD